MVNYIAVLVAAIACFAVGALWYGPLFGKQWMKMMGFSKDSMKKMKLSGPQAMVLGFLSTLVTAYVLSRIIGLAGGASVMSGIIVSLWVWLGFSAMLSLGSVLWEGRSVSLWILNAAHGLVSFVIMGAIIGAWM